MKLKDINIESSKKEKQAIRKFSTAEEALKNKHEIAREFFKNVELPK